MSDIQLFDNDDFGTIRAFLAEDGQPWFVAKDVAKALGYDSAAQMTRLLDKDEKGLQNVHTPGGNQQLSVITESGFYRSVMVRRSKFIKDDSTREFVVRFQRWVTHDVLPALRREGGYMVSRDGETPEETMARAVLLAQQTIDRQRRRVAELEARNAAIEPKAGFFDACMDGERWQSFTEVSRLFHQYDRTMTRKLMFELAQADGMITRDKQATRLAIDRGYFRNYQASAYFDQTTGEQVRPKPYAKFTGKGVRWALSRWLGKTATE